MGVSWYTNLHRRRLKDETKIRSVSGFFFDKLRSGHWVSSVPYTLEWLGLCSISGYTNSTIVHQLEHHKLSRGDHGNSSG